jgi:hypothetical protein
LLMLVVGELIQDVDQASRGSLTYLGHVVIAKLEEHLQEAVVHSVLVKKLGKFP